MDIRIFSWYFRLHRFTFIWLQSLLSLDLFVELAPPVVQFVFLGEWFACLLLSKVNVYCFDKTKILSVVRHKPLFNNTDKPLYSVQASKTTNTQWCYYFFYTYIQLSSTCKCVFDFSIISLVFKFEQFFLYRSCHFCFILHIWNFSPQSCPLECDG